VDAAGGRILVLIEGGVHRGTDVFKALALGARAVGIGRPYLWGLVSFGQPGIERVLDILRAESALANAPVRDAHPSPDHQGIRDHALNHTSKPGVTSERMISCMGRQHAGPVAQLGARFHGMEEVVSSNLTRSTILNY
jgi:hypothetical protein